MERINLLDCMLILIALISLVLLGFKLVENRTIDSKVSDISPTVCVRSGGGVKRFDLDKAREALVPLARMPTELNQYTFSPNECTTVYNNWTTDENALGRMCRLMMDTARFVITNPNTRDAAYSQAAIEDFILRYKSKIDAVAHPLKGQPWGNNWYQFTVTSTYMLAYYLLLPEPMLKDQAAALILDILTTPKKSLGYARDGSNSVYMAGPWILAKYVQGVADEAAKSDDYQYAVQQLQMDLSLEYNVKGLHRDYSYYQHNLGMFFQYLQALTSDYAPCFYAFDTLIERNPVAVWDTVSSYLRHPSVPFGNVGLIGRNRSIAQRTDPKAPLGIAVMPFGRYIRYHTEHYQFSMRAQTSYLAFYEADQHVNDMAQYWVQYRNVHSVDSKDDVPYPNVGMINKETNTALIAVPSTTNTTQAFMPTLARSFVLKYKQYGALYQEYTIQQFGKFGVKELVVMNSDKKSVAITLQITNNHRKERLVYYGAEIKKYTIEVGESNVYRTFINMADGTMSTAQCSKASFPSFPYKLADPVWSSKTTPTAVCCTTRNNRRSTLL